MILCYYSVVIGESIMQILSNSITTELTSHEENIIIDISVEIFLKKHLPISQSLKIAEQYFIANKISPMTLDQWFDNHFVV